eukprot:TRINITY_DN4880_c0_g1_i1.p1 TRINITY_DN4880_c0_g1~~TRINITY_DN4880_c0_g1_i1.p1  ORF type:complete len:276 (+),score=43.80 TRINITY_DN4880_c0_g1_i1:3-830(+)
MIVPTTILLSPHTQIKIQPNHRLQRRTKCYSRHRINHPLLSTTTTMTRDLSYHPPLFAALERFYSECSVSHTTPSACWRCHAEIVNDYDFCCGDCGAVLPVRVDEEKINIFKFFGLDNDFNVDVSLLESEFKRRQRVLHPDLQHGKSEEEQGYAQEQSSLLNRLYNNIKTPFYRAEHLLKIKGVDDIQNLPEAHDTSMLMQLLQRRTIIEQAKGEELKKLKSETEKEMDGVEGALAEAFSKNDITQSVKLTIKFQYLTAQFKAATERIHQEDMKN